MMYRITYRGRPIGTSLLADGDPSTGIAFGQFHPLPAYELVRPVFLLFADSLGHSTAMTDQAKLAQYYEARDALDLTLQTSEGASVEISWIQIVDWSTIDKDAPYEIEVHVPDKAFWER